LTNALNHAGPRTRVRLSVTALHDRVEVEIVDTGPDTLSTRRHERAHEHGHDGHGLSGMRERAALYGGTLTAGPSLSRGWTVQASLDLAADTPGSSPAQPPAPATRPDRGGS